ncbi:Uncharacterised protein [Klebsiella pneumoniae]|nr:Uncharacterised protein [Klebsiella pneumoniae]
MDLPVWLKSSLCRAPARAQALIQFSAQARSPSRPLRMYWVTSLVAPRSMSVMSLICERKVFSALTLRVARAESEPSYLLVKTRLPVYGGGTAGQLPALPLRSPTAA